MAPVAVGHVVSFSSQDPRFPVENLLRGDGLRPWLSCPHDQSRQLKAELQLERASAIGYIDVGNCGCAFLQIDVGRSSWPLSQPYVTLLPSVTLMTPADSKLDRNRCGVRMFKEADFLALAVGQKWDRLRLICSQPFSKHGQFGLSFIRVRTPLEADRGQPPPPSQQGLEDPESAASPWHSNPAFCKIFFPEPRVSTREEEQLKSHLQQLEPGPESRAWSPARLSRPARMVLSAAQRRARKPRASTGSVGSNQEQAAEDPGGPAASGLCQLPQGRPGQEEEPEPGAMKEDWPGPGRAEERAVRGRRARAPSAQVVSAWSSFLRTPPAVGRKTSSRRRTGPPLRGWICPLTPGCRVRSASSGSARGRWRDTPAPAGSRQEPWAPRPLPSGWSR
ncbi:protein XNDC1N isoform X2 [Rhea pennata]|uniref:protein XNDC1N isoform X2 n=1 Tax=Rhea pennata TaxID=8795 RepID=UPI002E256BF8